MRTRVKICGLTRIEDALEAARSGVDAIGLVFYAKSPRNVALERARAIASATPGFVSVVGLFVDAPPEWVTEVQRQVPLDILQFHGDEPAAYCESFGKPYVKAIRMNERTDLTNLASVFRASRGLLLDVDDPLAKGGTGERFDWSLAPKYCDLPMILAGGLTVDNVVSALSQVAPYAVDVSSGVESAKGIKDTIKMKAFLNEVYEFDYKHRRVG